MYITGKHDSYIDDFLHDIPSILLIAEETLKTNDMNQKKLTMLPNGVCESGRENWRVVAVTLEKKVAIVVILMYRVVALSFSSASMLPFFSHLVSKQAAPRSHITPRASLALVLHFVKKSLQSAHFCL